MPNYSVVVVHHAVVDARDEDSARRLTMDSIHAYTTSPVAVDVKLLEEAPNGPARLNEISRSAW